MRRRWSGSTIGTDKEANYCTGAARVVVAAHRSPNDDAGEWTAGIVGWVRVYSEAGTVTLTF